MLLEAQVNLSILTTGMVTTQENPGDYAEYVKALAESYSQLNASDIKKATTKSRQIVASGLRKLSKMLDPEFESHQALANAIDTARVTLGIVVKGTLGGAYGTQTQFYQQVFNRANPIKPKFSWHAGPI